MILLLYPALEGKLDKRISPGTSYLVEGFRRKIYDSLMGHVWVYDNETKSDVNITSEEFRKNRSRYTHHNEGKVTVYDYMDDIHVSIPCDEYYENLERYKWIERKIRQRYVNDETGEERKFFPEDVPEGWSHYNSVREREPNEYAHMRGLVPVYNLNTNETIKVTVDQFTKMCSENPEVYCHPTKKPGAIKTGPIGLVNVYFLDSKTTGSISREEFKIRNNIDVIHASRRKKYLEINK